jgi:uncharacterized surface protein with fasciclin (FAS1) repeats
MKSNWNRRTVLKTVGSTGALLATGVGSAAAQGPPSDGQNIVEKVQSLNSNGGRFDGEFDILIAAVTKAGLVPTLTGNRRLTVFGPTDAAFETALGITDSGQLDGVENLESVLKYHVVPGLRDAESVTSSDRLPTLLNGELIDVDGTDLNGDQADIIVTDVEASNGIIHAIGPSDGQGGVLLP